MLDELIHRLPPSILDVRTERHGFFYFMAGNTGGTHWRAGYKSEDGLAYADLQIEGDSPEKVLRELMRRVVTYQVDDLNSKPIGHRQPGRPNAQG